MADICRRYRIREPNISGSATRDDIGPRRDIDVLVKFEPGLSLELWMDYPDLLEDLQRLFGRDVDVVQGRASLANPFRREVILKSLERLNAA